MKTWLKKVIIKIVGPGLHNPAFVQGNEQQQSGPFEPAPSYWALIPVKVETSRPTRHPDEEDIF